MHNDCLLLEYVPNMILFKEMIGRPPVFYLELVSQSIQALRYLHSKNLIHGDLHSEQWIWDTDRQRVFLIDFEKSELNKSATRFKEDRGDLALILWQIIDGPVPGDVEWDVDGGEHQLLKKYIQKKRTRYPAPLVQAAINMILSLI